MIAEITNTYALANALLDKHGLSEQGWTFDFSDHKRIVGQCRYGSKKILFSKYFLHIGNEEIKDTILHEIAHALTPGHGHDHVWRAKAIEVGARPERCISGVQASSGYNYEVECSKCGAIVARRYRIKQAMYRYISACCNASLEVYDLREEG